MFNCIRQKGKLFLFFIGTCLAVAMWGSLLMGIMYLVAESTDSHQQKENLKLTGNIFGIFAAVGGGLLSLVMIIYCCNMCLLSICENYTKTCPPINSLTQTNNKLEIELVR